MPCSPVTADLKTDLPSNKIKKVLRSIKLRLGSCVDILGSLCGDQAS